MKRNRIKQWKNVPFQTWEYEPQTEMKHKVLKYYLPMWAKILGKYYNELNYVDGFGGIGAYHTDEDVKNNKYTSQNFGSPIFSMQTIVELKNDGIISYANALIIDKEKSNLNNIEKIHEHQKINMNMELMHGNFDDEINKFLDEYDKQSPTFFLIDPFGFSIKLETIERIMKRGKTEIVINFMYNAVQWHISHPNPKINKIYDELFVTNEWQKYSDKHGQEKELALVNLFRKQCKNFTKFVYPFKLNFPEQNRPYYYLFHLSNHHLACKLMKESFASQNNGEFEYKGSKKHLQFSLFKGNKHETPSWNNLCLKCFSESPESNSCEKCMTSLFKGQKISYEDFLKQVIDMLPFTEKEIKKMLNDFEEQGIIEITSKRNRRKGIEKDDILCFLRIGIKNE